MAGIGTFYICVVLFALGTLGAQFTPVVIPAWCSALAGIALIPCFVLPALRPFAWFAAGLLWALLRADLLLAVEWPASLESRDVTLIGTVAGLPERAERYLKFDLDVERARSGERAVAFDGRVRLRWYEPDAVVRDRLKAGSRWRLRARLKQPHGHYNPGGFDYEAYLYRERIRATGYVRPGSSNTRLALAAPRSLAAFRQALRADLDALLARTAQRTLLLALTLGDRSALSDAQWDTLRATGTSHLMAISGLHVGCAAGFGALLGLWAGRLAAIPAQTLSAAPRIAAAGALCLAGFYAGLSGFEVPAQRALVMVSVFLLALWCRRHAWSGRALGLALVAVLIMRPASVLDPGFWLSFGAVALILAWLSRPGAVGRSRWLAALQLQALLSVALLPLVAGFFGIASLVSAPANLVAVPVVMVAIVPLCLLGVAALTLGLPAAAAPCLALADAVLDRLWRYLSWLEQTGYAAVPWHLAPWQALVLMGGVAWLLAAKPGRRRWGAAAVVVLLAPGPPPPAPGAFRAVVLDVGQGLAVVVRTARHTLVYDTGPSYPGGFSLAEAVVVPYLRTRGVERLDALVISHGDNDHRGGYEVLQAAFPGRRVLTSIADALPGAAFCVAGQRWVWDGVVFEVLHPPGRRPPAHNNSSCVLKVSGRHGSLLLTGDIEARVERRLQPRPGLRSDVLLVPHQGSATSSTPAFIDRVDPLWAIVSAGYLNRYGHPHPDVVARYRRRGIAVVNTAHAGAVIVELGRDGIRVERWREARPRYWLDRE